MTSPDSFSFTTKLWKRSQNSYATTIPQNILLMRRVPTDKDVKVEWTVNAEGDITIEFVTEDDDE